MDSSLERSILVRAIAEGLISASDLQAIEEQSDAETPTVLLENLPSRLTLLVQKGLLSLEAIRRLRAEVGVGQSPAPNKMPGSPGPHMEKFGRFERLEFIGEGGMAKVYKAFDPVLGRAVALKFIRREDPELIRRLLVEARHQARIDHSNVCKVFEVGESDNAPYVAMQFINGKTLNKIKGDLSLEQKVRLMRDVAEAVHAAHRVGLIHRDLKPSNIIVERNEKGAWIPYVLDFGLAREVEAPGLTATGVIVGTPWYMSPEQARGDTRQLDRRTDIYALGATAYELLTGSLPFQADNALDILFKVLREEPRSVRALQSSIPADIETIVMKCLEKEPDRRYDSAKALAGDLERYLNGDLILGAMANAKGWESGSSMVARRVGFSRRI